MGRDQAARSLARRPTPGPLAAAVVLPAALIPGLFLLATLPLWLAALRLCGMDPGRAAREVVWLYGRMWSDITALALPFAGRTSDPRGLPTPCILVSNHQSFFDVYCLGAQPLRDVVFVVRNWPFRIPFYRPVMRLAGYLNSEAMDHEALLARGGELLARGANLHFFPEGSRSRNGALARFKSGAFRLAVDTGTPIVPFCIAGTGELMSPGRLLPSPARLAVKLLPPVSPEPYRGEATGHLAMAREVRGMMAETIARMKRDLQGYPHA